MSEPDAADEEDEWNKSPANYRVHKKASKQQWDQSRAVRSTKGGKAQFNPYTYRTYDLIHALELRCIDEGTSIYDGGDLKTYYMEDEMLVGASKGEKTYLVFVEWHKRDGFHGRPISRQELRTKGVAV